jgi:hypothetical integral membrane protein (TIGR02206 family)
VIPQLRGARWEAAEFRSFTPTHLLILGLFLLGCAVAVGWGRRHRGTAAEQGRRRALAAAIVLFAVPMQLYQLTPGVWDLDSSLPIQLCDLSWMVAVWALWSKHPWATALTYYWGLSITTQAIVTPSLDQEFPDPRFVGFWGMHLLIVWAAVCLTWGFGVRPTWGSYRVAVVATALWAAAVFAFNAAADTNYGYLNSKPSSASLLSLLGPWPWYVLAEIAIVCVGWAAMTWPWNRDGGQRDARGAAAGASADS